MKRLIAILFHPREYYFFKRNQERMTLLHTACEILHIEEPTVWDVDRLHQMLNTVVSTIYDNPDMFKNSKPIRKHLFWTLLLLKFKKFTLTREDTKDIIDVYNLTLKYISEGQHTTFDVAQTHILMVKMFGDLIWERR